MVRSPVYRLVGVIYGQDPRDVGVIYGQDPGIQGWCKAKDSRIWG